MYTRGIIETWSKNAFNAVEIFQIQDHSFKSEFLSKLECIYLLACIYNFRYDLFVIRAIQNRVVLLIVTRRIQRDKKKQTYLPGEEWVLLAETNLRQSVLLSEFWCYSQRFEANYEKPIRGDFCADVTNQKPDCHSWRNREGSEVIPPSKANP